MTDWKFLELDDDEAEHNKHVSETIQWHLGLANDAALLALNGLSLANDMPEINQPKGIALLLMIKTAQNIRFAVSGLRLGYYSGGSAVLRSALEGLSYSALFLSDPGQVAIWLKNEFSKKNLDMRRKDQDDQSKAAKDALLQWESHPCVVKDATNEFWRQANKRIHSTLEGLSEEFGIGMEYFVPDDFEEAFLKAGEDFDKAWEYYVLLGRFDNRIPHSREHNSVPETETTGIELVGRYHETTLSDLSMFTFYIAHRLLDLVNDNFSISDRGYLDTSKKWHRLVRRVLKPL